jgi:hypothetical protein
LDFQQRTFIEADQFNLNYNVSLLSDGLENFVDGVTNLSSLTTAPVSEGVSLKHQDLKERDEGRRRRGGGGQEVGRRRAGGGQG